MADTPKYVEMTVVPRKDMNLTKMIKDCVEDSERWFPGEAQELPNLVLCIAGEVGEVANIVKKVVRGSLRMEDAMETLPEEIVDVLIYLCNLMGHEQFKDVDWKKIWDDKLKYNESRFGYLASDKPSPSTPGGSKNGENL